MFQKTTIIGNVGNVEELSFGTKVAVAVNRNYKKDDEWVQETTWFSVLLKGRNQEIAQQMSLAKGDLVYAELDLSVKEKDGVYYNNWFCLMFKRISKKEVDNTDFPV